MSVLLTFLVHITIGKFDTKILVDRELPMNQSCFDELYQFSLLLSHCISKGRSTGASNYTVMMVDNPLPAVCLSKKNTIRPNDDECMVDNHSAKSSDPANAVIYKDTLLNFL